MKLFVTERARKDLKQLPSAISARIIDKIEWYAAQEMPLSFAKPLAGLPGIYRYRIGAYRVIVSSEGEVLSIIRVRKRAEAYR